MAKVLFTRPSFDIATDYLHAYAGELKQYAIDNGHTVFDLEIQNATTVNFEQTMALENPDIAILAGHGNETLMTGQDFQPLIKLGVNDDILNDKKGYLIACATGARLGPAMVEPPNTCQEYYGWAADFVFVYDPGVYETGRLLEDSYAQPFFDCALAAGHALLNGAEPWEVYGLTIGRYTYWWNHWIKQNDPLADDVLTWLEWNKSNFRALTPTGIYAEKAEPAVLTLSVLPLAAAASLFFLLLSNK